jgi:hypothetical protein
MPDRAAPRTTVVFLRPFHSDTLVVPAHSGQYRGTDWALLPRRTAFLEDVATRLLWARGQVIAVGDPRGGSTSTLGAARHPLTADTDWQTSVYELLEHAVAICLVPGSTFGISWETHVVIGIPRFLKKAIVINPDPADGARFLEAVGASIQQVEELQHRGLIALAAVGADHGVRLLCASSYEDVASRPRSDGF